MIRSRVPLLLAAVSATLLLAGCVGGGGDPTPKPSASDAPLFSSDEDALKAAEKAYQAYLDVSDQVGASGWQDSTPLATVATGRLLQTDTDGAKSFSDKGLVQSGRSGFDSMRLQDRSAEIVVYVCLDISGTDVIDASGVSVVPADRPTRLPLEVTFTNAKAGLLAEQSVTWSGENFC